MCLLSSFSLQVARSENKARCRLSRSLSHVSGERDRITAVAWKVNKKKAEISFFYGWMCKNQAPTLIPMQLLFLESCATPGWGLLVSSCVAGSRPSSGWLRSPAPIHLGAARMWPLLIKPGMRRGAVPPAARDEELQTNGRRGGWSPISVQWCCCRLPGTISLFITHLCFCLAVSPFFSSSYNCPPSTAPPHVWPFMSLFFILFVASVSLTHLLWLRNTFP